MFSNLVLYNTEYETNGNSYMLENLPFKLCTSGFNPKVKIYAKVYAHGLSFEGRTSTF